MSKLRNPLIKWDISGWYGPDLDVAACTFPGCSWFAEMATSGHDDLDEFTRWVCAHADTHGEAGPEATA